jgi:hypothetical protein
MTEDNQLESAQIADVGALLVAMIKDVLHCDKDEPEFGNVSRILERFGEALLALQDEVRSKAGEKKLCLMEKKLRDEEVEERVFSLLTDPGDGENWPTLSRAIGSTRATKGELEGILNTILLGGQLELIAMFETLPQVLVHLDGEMESPMDEAVNTAVKSERSVVRLFAYVFKEIFRTEQWRTKLAMMRDEMNWWDGPEAGDYNYYGDYDCYDCETFEEGHFEN